jgi:hypothetical protein
MDKEEKNKRQREIRKGNNNAWTKKYERTKKGFLMRKYHHMMGRVNGEAWYNGVHLWAGKEILDKNIFYEWALADKNFHDLFEKWEESGYERNLCPSVDRIDSSKGYLLGNMEWVTFLVNATRGAHKRWGIKNDIS